MVVTDAAVAELAPVVGTAAACTALGRPRSSYYRTHRRSPAPPKPPPAPRKRQPRALSPAERQAVLDVLHEPRFVDSAPASVYATLLDEDAYLASISTMYRILRDHGEVRERRRQATHPAHVKPELIASGAKEVWSWDITKLLGPAKWTYYYLYVILDIYSRYVPGWLLAPREDARLAERLLADTIVKQNVPPGRLTVHADRGSSMASKPVAFLLADLGVTKSHSRPHNSNDNPFSESQFKTLKYRPEFPERFGSIEDGRAFCRMFFARYNTVHRSPGVDRCCTTWHSDDIWPVVQHASRAVAHVAPRVLEKTTRGTKLGRFRQGRCRLRVPDGDARRPRRQPRACRCCADRPGRASPRHERPQASLAARTAAEDHQ